MSDYITRALKKTDIIFIKIHLIFMYNFDIVCDNFFYIRYWSALCSVLQFIFNRTYLIFKVNHNNSTLTYSPLLSTQI